MGCLTAVKVNASTCMHHKNMLSEKKVTEQYVQYYNICKEFQTYKIKPQNYLGH